MPILGIWASEIQASKASSFDSIATQTVGAGGAASVTFSSIPSTYKHLQVRAIGRGDTSASSVYAKLQFNSDTASNYRSHYLYGDGATAYAGDDGANAFIIAERFTAATATLNVFAGYVMDILDYADTNKFKTTRTLAGFDRNGSGEVYLFSGLWRSTSAITSITFTPSAGNFVQYSTFALYGVK